LLAWPKKTNKKLTNNPTTLLLVDTAVLCTGIFFFYRGAGAVYRHRGEVKNAMHI
jgi:hypothetical protein